jgi:hypothetical protein
LCGSKFLYIEAVPLSTCNWQAVCVHHERDPGWVTPPFHPPTKAIKLACKMWRFRGQK